MIAFVLALCASAVLVLLCVVAGLAARTRQLRREVDALAHLAQVLRGANAAFTSYDERLDALELRAGLDGPYRAADLTQPAGES